MSQELTGDKLQSAIRKLVGSHPWINHTLITAPEWARLYSLASQHGFPALRWCLDRAAEAKKPPFGLGSYVQGIANRHAKDKPWATESAVPVDLSSRFIREDQ